MKKNLRKKALSFAAALVVFISAVETAAAADKNEIKISSSADTVKSGDDFTVTLSYEPDSTGVSSFIIYFCYDSEAVLLNFDASSDYTSSAGFSVVSDYEYADGTIRITGANMSSENVSEAVSLADFSFTVCEDFSGEISFWTEVESLVYSDGDSYVNAEFRHNNIYDPFVVTAVNEDVSEDCQNDTDDSDCAYDADDSNDGLSSESSEDSISEARTDDLSCGGETADSAAEAEDVQTSAYEDETAETAEDTEETGVSETGTLFSYEQGSGDYNNESAVQYAFSPYDYISGNPSSADIEVSVTATGYCVVGIGMETSDGWKIYSAPVSAGSGTVTAENIDLTDVSGDIYVQLYYLKHDSSFEINAVSVTDLTIADQTICDESEASEEDEEASDENAETDSGSSEVLSESSETVSETQIAETANTEASDETSETSEETNASESDSQKTTASYSDEQSEVLNAAGAASEAADSNPDTGTDYGLYICGGLVILCLVQMIYSIYTAIRANGKS